ncbi:MAG: hypothetical protein JW940_39045 [Polyangiaceae bacterium]|nr:hypothetical protein [Polyangiaceae bacterium]
MDQRPKVRLQHQSCVVRSDVANGCAVVQIHELVSGTHELLLSLAQFFVLELELDLVCLEFRYEPRDLRVGDIGARP